TQAKVTINEDFLTEYNNVKNNYDNSSLEIISKPDSLAYIIYTSGTTGQPKGVMIENRSLVDRLLYEKDILNVDENDSILFSTNFVFDVSVLETLFPLLFGAKVFIPLKNNLLDSSNFIEYILQKRITLLQGTPSFFSNILKNKTEYEINHKIQFCIGGESLTRDTIGIIEDVFTSLTINNHYGPTETTIDSIVKQNIKSEEFKIDIIGRPISNTQVYILDQDKKVVPIGVTGKLYVAGAGLSRGYLNKPELTAEKFIVNPFVEGTKMYDTGDLARWLPDGNIEFLGRADFQVKIRGYRIELGEIETSLSQFSQDIAQVVVEAKEINSEKVLVAYYTTRENKEIDKTNLREYLQSKLPEYMVPSYFVELETIPLTPNGKIDRKGLPSVSGEDLIRREYIAPRNETEEQLVTIWQEVLGVENIGITDSFFELGGHSLMAAQVLNKMHQRLSLQISFKDFFATPTIEGISKNLSHKNYLAIPRASVQENYPLTPSQQRLWVLSQLEGGSQAYNMPAVVRLKGELDVTNFEKAFQELIAKHEILRTCFKSDKATGEIRQYINAKENITFDLTVLDFQDADGVAIENYLEQTNAEAFDLEQGPLLRASLLQKGANEYVFFLSMHHIIGDGWSTELLISEVVNNYNSLLQDGVITATELPIQYKDYAVWLQEEIKGEKYEKAEKYWLKQFSGELPVLDLPSYKTRPLIQTYNGDNVSQLFSKEFTSKLKQYSEDKGVTLFMTLMAGIKALLYRYTGQTDLVIGTPIAGREHPDLENQIGLYLNILAIRTQLEDDENSFASLLQKEKEILLGAYEHQLYPFDELVGKLNLKRDTSRSALFDVLVVLQNQNQLRLGDTTNDIKSLEVEEYDYHRKTSQFDVSYTFAEEADQLGLTIEYNTDIYDLFLIRRMFAHLESLVTQAIENDTQLIESIDFLSNQERHQLVYDFNNTKVDYPKDKTIVELFEVQAAKTPDNVAVQDSLMSFTYKELQFKSNAVATYLTSKFGLDKEPIGIIVNRSADLIVLLLGILKSGKSYIPIDPLLPKERIKYIIHQSNSRVLIIEDDFLNDFESTKESSDKVSLISKKEILEFEGNISFNSNSIKVDDTAYIIYTSGSTGNPKGVEIPHKALCNFLVSMQNQPGIESQDILFSVTTYSFDISILEFFVPLISGARVYVVSKEVLGNIDVLKETLTKVNPSIIQATPSFYQMLFNANWEGSKKLKVLCGGDSLNESLSKQLLDSCQEVWNMYGPTETTIWSSCKKIEKPSDASNIGKPIANTQIYIVDANLNLLPSNTVGRIFIAGDGLAKGYYNNPELTAERFINNPFEQGVLMYEVGDLGKWNEKGEIEFLGRNDFQVKIRGFRIELGEIESKLQENKQIIQAVVDTKEINGQKYLVAYYTERGESELDTVTLKSYLQERLPDYMVPNFFVKLTSIPLTPNGKVNRKALPEISEENIVKKTYIAPQTTIEVALVSIWQEILNVENIGITDNFFELGGHSLLAIKTIHRINKLYEININLNQFFDLVTIQELGRKINNLQLLKDITKKEYENSESETFTI
ncbi:non-ribosomal peptide synthetase, partial [Flavobacterium oreochromis]